MKTVKNYGYIFVLFLVSFVHCNEELETNVDLCIKIKAEKTKKALVGIVVVGDFDKSLSQLSSRIAQDMEWSGQCSVMHKNVAKISHESELKALFPCNVSGVIFLSKVDESYAWRLYDVENFEMIAGKKIKRDARGGGEILSLSMLGHTIADEIWPILFGTQSSFRSKIAYCKQVWRKKFGREKSNKQIWIADFDGSNARLFINAPTVSFAPRWNKDLECPLLFYSENTLSNVQLVMSNMYSKRKVVCCFDGLNMQPTFSPDGKKVVFCLSKDGTSQLYVSFFDHASQRRKFDRLTFNSGNNISPCFVDATHIVFVSDFETNKPQLYMLDLHAKTVNRITDGHGYCACPSFSAVKKQLVYSKMMGRGMQLFSYDVLSKHHQQLTHDAGSKEEASWSPCGNYIVFGWNHGDISRIAQLHLPTKTVRFLTTEVDNCTYPDCSPIYAETVGFLNN